MPTIPASIQGDPRSMQMLLVVDEASEYVFQGRPVFGDNLWEAMKIMMETFRGGGMGGRKGLPDKIIFSSRKLCTAIAPSLEPMGVKCFYEPVIPKLQAIVADLIEHLGISLPSSAKSKKAPSGLDAAIPAPDDLSPHFSQPMI